MPMATLLGLSFGLFPCLMFGFIMLLSLLLCEYIEEYVAKHLCTWKHRRRRGLRSFYRDFRDRRSHNDRDLARLSSRVRPYHAPGGVVDPTAGWSRDGDLPIDVSGDVRFTSDAVLTYNSPTAPPQDNQRVLYAAQLANFPNYSLLAANDPPPSYEECVLPQVRMQSGRNANGGRVNRSGSEKDSKDAKPTSRKPSKKSSSKEKDY